MSQQKQIIDKTDAFFLKKIGEGCVVENKYYFCNRFWKTKALKDDSVAQQVEHIPFKDGVLGSNPSWVTYQGGMVEKSFRFFINTMW